MPWRAQKPDSLQPLTPVLAQTLRQVGLERVMLLVRLTQHWREIAGAQVAAIAQPENVRGRVLFVTVADAIWLQQLTFYQAQLLRNIRRVLGDVPIGKLHFALATAPVPTRSDVADASASVPLSTVEERQVLEDTAAIADADLREVVQRVWRRGLQLRR